MKVAISAYGTDMDSEINPRFGRCDYLLIVDTADNSLESFANENMNLGGGAGIQTASFVLSKGIQAVITGSCGPNAMDVFNSAGVDVYTGQAGTVSQALARLSQGELAPSAQPNAAEKSGMASVQQGNPPAGGGRGGGCRAMGGQGMGRGGGRGRGMGFGMGRKR